MIQRETEMQNRNLDIVGGAAADMKQMAHVRSHSVLRQGPQSGPIAEHARRMAETLLCMATLQAMAAWSGRRMCSSKDARDGCDLLHGTLSFYTTCAKFAAEAMSQHVLDILPPPVPGVKLTAAFRRRCMRRWLLRTRM